MNKKQDRSNQLNLVLKPDMMRWLNKNYRQTGIPKATFVKMLILKSIKN